MKNALTDIRKIVNQMLKSKHFIELMNISNIIHKFGLDQGEKESILIYYFQEKLDKKRFEGLLRELSRGKPDEYI